MVENSRILYKIRKCQAVVIGIVIAESWPVYNQFPTGFRSVSDRVPTGFRPGSDRIPIGFRRGFRPDSHRIPTGFRPGFLALTTRLSPASGRKRVPKQIVRVLNGLCVRRRIINPKTDSRCISIYTSARVRAEGVLHAHARARGLTSQYISARAFMSLYKSARARTIARAKDRHAPRSIIFPATKSKQGDSDMIVCVKVGGLTKLKFLAESLRFWY